MKIHLINRFILCGFTGWIFECFWTGLHSIVTANRLLTCKTSIWMFPIYGFAAFIAPISTLLQRKCMILRGGVYTLLIFLTEFVSGSILKFFHVCPWNYQDAKFQLKGVIRFDYAPLWFLVGLAFEKILKESSLWAEMRAAYKKNNP